MSGVGKAFFGSCGDGGTANDWRVGSGAPSLIAGDEEGDLYLDTDSGDVYQVQSGAWVLVANIEGPAGADGEDGSTIFSDTGVPSGGLGVDGDFYVETTIGIANLLYEKVNGAWLCIAKLGDNFYTGDLEGGTPSDSIGIQGDFFIDVTPGSFALWGPKLVLAGGDPCEVGTWVGSGPESLVGPAGAEGPAGEGVPTGGDTDDYLAKVSGTDFDTEWRSFEGEGMRLTGSTGGASGNQATNTPVTINWDVIEEEHPSAGSIFTFTDANDTITIGEDGLYSIHFGLSIRSNSLPAMLTVSNARVRAQLEVDTGGGFNTLGRPHTTDLVWVRNQQRWLLDAQMLYAASAGDIIRLNFGKLSGGMFVSVVPNASHLTIFKIK